MLVMEGPDAPLLMIPHKSGKMLRGTVCRASIAVKIRQSPGNAQHRLRINPQAKDDKSNEFDPENAHSSGLF
jgi:hypothetical protein